MLINGSFELWPDVVLFCKVFGRMMVLPIFKLLSHMIPTLSKWFDVNGNERVAQDDSMHYLV